MATILDLGLLQFFVPAIVWVFVFVIIWAILEKTKMFAENKFANIMIAFCTATLFILVPELTSVLVLATPWFAILLILSLLMVLVILFLGVKPEAVAEVFGGGTLAFWLLMIIFLGIIGYAFTQVYGEQVRNLTESGDTAEGDITSSVAEILFTPKVLAMILILGVSALVVRYVSDSVVMR